MSAAWDDEEWPSEARDHETADFEWVTPELARYWLTFNTHNRNLSQPVADSFVWDMEHGEWKVNGNGIQFDRNGVLIDGQKRLKAIVDSGIQQKQLVVRGLEPEAQESIDIGQPRSTANILQLRGETHSDAMTALARMCVAFKPGREGKKISSSEITRAIDADPSIRWIANEIVPSLISIAKPGKISNPSTIGYSYWRLNQVDSEACAEFFHSVAALTNLEEGDPCLSLRNRLEADREKSRNTNNVMTRKKAVALFMRAWNHWRKGERRKHFRLNYEGRNHVLIIDEPI